MHVILIPGMWLDASSWDAVTPALEEAGHQVHALTLPGMMAGYEGLSGIRLRDHVAAVVESIDELDPAEGRVVLVAHSRGGAAAHAAVDARPDRVARVVYVASEPTPDGWPGPEEYPAADGGVPLPDWSLFVDGELDGFDEAGLAALRARSLPSPVHAVRDVQHLADERRYDVPITVVTCELSAAMYRGWVAEGHPGAAELAAIRDVEYVDLPTGHWPQFTRPDDLARILVDAIARA